MTINPYKKNWYTFWVLSVGMFLVFFLSSTCRYYKLEQKLNPVDKEWLSKVGYIITSEERKLFLDLPNSEKDQFKEDFWLRRDPDPTTEENEFKMEYEARIETANEIFTSESRQGIFGATQDNAESLVPLARSWLLPPKLIVETGATSSQYDLTQRCYVISRSKGCGGEILRFRLEADSENPIVNPAFVITNWGNRGGVLQVNGKAVPRDKAFRFGHVRRINQYDLVVWIQLESDQTVEISLSPKEE